MSESWQEIREAFERALSLDEAKRHDYLEGLRLRNRALATEVESLLAADEESDEIFSDLAESVSSLDESLVPTVQPIPDSLGSFPVEGVLGRGGMGIVYRAHDTKLDRAVAIKVLPISYQKDRRSIEHLHREAKLIAALNHPAIAAIHSLETTSDGVSFLVMELVEGQSLRERLRDGELPRNDALRIGCQIAEALQAAHELGIVHRDLKPDNVMVTPQGRVKVLDFGIAKFVGNPDPDEASVSHGDSKVDDDLPKTLGRVGTPGYMSPEQIRGGVIDGQSDVFGLGCVLYECLAGRPAFPGSDPEERMAKTEGDVMDWSRIAGDTQLRDFLAASLRRDPAARPSGAAAALQVMCGLLDGPESPAAPRKEPPHNLPRERTAFIGRGSDLLALERSIEQSRLVTLTGSGGSGKTRLALELARRRRFRAPDGTWWADLSPIRGRDRVLQVLHEALGAASEVADGELEAIPAVLRRLAGHRATVLFDNCEHVLEDVAQVVGQLLDRCPNVRVIVTSRIPLGLSDESIYQVPLLSLPDPGIDAEGTVIDVETVLASDSVRLFVEHARRHRADFEFDVKNASPVVEICRRLEGVPLAIELAAARVRLLSPDQILELLVDRFRLLTGGAAEHQRQRTLHNAIAWSYDLLDEMERRLFRSLSVFAGGWTLRSATAVTTMEEFALLDGLTSLANKSLIEVGQGKDGEPRYRFLETTRQFAHQVLVETADAASVTARHFGYFYRLAEEAQKGLNGPDHGTWSLRLEAEHDNVLAALEAPADGLEAESRLLEMAGFLIMFWLSRGYLSEARTALVSILDRTTTHTVSRARALKALAAIEHGQGNLEAARRFAREGLSIVEDVGGDLDQAAALHGVALMEAEFRHDDVAIGLFERALELFVSVGDERGQGSTELNLGLLVQRSGDSERAVCHMERSAEILRRIGNLQTLANTLGNLASSLINLGREGEALAHLIEGLDISRALRLYADGAHLMLVASHWALGRESWDSSAWSLGVAEGIWKRMGAQPTPGERRSLEEIEKHMGNVPDGTASSIAMARERGLLADFEVAMAEARDWLEPFANSLQ